MQAAFVQNYVRNGGAGGAAAKAAGYAAERPDVPAWTLLQSPVIQSAIAAERRRVFNGLACEAPAILGAIMRDEGAKAADRIRACQLVVTIARDIGPQSGDMENSSDNKRIEDMTAAEMGEALAAIRAQLATIDNAVAPDAPLGPGDPLAHAIDITPLSGDGSLPTVDSDP